MTSKTAPAELDDVDLEQRIREGAAALAMPVTGRQVTQLVAHVRLIARWNATYNLTAVRDPRQMVTQHVLDCLAATAALLRRRDGSRSLKLLDVGSGPGLPGLVIAVMAPIWTVVCVDSVGKKAAFMTQAIGGLGLSNATAEHQRVESLAGAPFDVIACRAFASLGDFVASTRSLLAASGEWMAMKGKVPVEELKALEPASFHVEPVAVPGLEAERCIVWIQNEK